MKLYNQLINIPVRPVRAKIHVNENMEEHRRYKLRCAVFGSKPAPVIDWYINGNKIDSSYPMVSIRLRALAVNSRKQ